MPAPDPPAILPRQVLADPTGRRRRRMAVAGRVVTMALGLWLVVLILGGLGLQPLAGLPLGPHEAAPPVLPGRVQAAVARGATVAPTKQTARIPVTTVPIPSRRPSVTAPSRAKTRSPARTTPRTGVKHTNTNPSRALTSPAPATSPTTTTKPSSTAPGQTKTETSPSSTAPGQTRTAPGQTKTEPGPPTTTPGTTPRTKGKSYNAKGTVTTP